MMYKISTLIRKVKQTLWIHRYEILTLKKYWKHGKVLDVGAGRDSRKLSDNVVSFDIRLGRDAYTRMLRWKEPVLPHVVGDALTLPFKDNSFDVVMASHLIEHVPDVVELFAEFFRVVKPGGIICGIIPNSYKFGSEYWKDWTHVHGWMPESFKIILGWRCKVHNGKIIQYNEMSKLINGYSFDFAVRKEI